MSGTITVVMLDVLRERFEQWLAANGLELGHVPDTARDTYIVVPSEMHPR